MHNALKYQAGADLKLRPIKFEIGKECSNWEKCDHMENAKTPWKIPRILASRTGMNPAVLNIL